MATDWTKSTRALKIVVFVLGIAILLGSTGLVIALVKRGGKAIERATETPAPASTTAAGNYVSAIVALPGGGRALSMTGNGDRLSLLVEGADGRQRIVTLDRRTGAVLGTLTLAPVR